MKTHILKIETGHRRTIVDLTADVQEFVKGEGDGLINLSLPHATAGLALMELGSGSEEDLMQTIDRMIPRKQGLYRHSHGSTGHGADHLLPAFITPTLTLPVHGGQVHLGTWQSIALVDTNEDNPRREVHLAFLPSR